MPTHHNLDRYFEEYIAGAGIAEDRKGPLFRTTRGRSGELTDNSLLQSDVWRMIRRRALAAGIKEGQPADLLRDPISALPDWYTKMFWNMVTSVGSDRTLIQAATLTLSYDLGKHQPGPRAEYPQSPYTCDVSILDTRGKTYSAHFEGWWGEERMCPSPPARRWWNPITWLGF